MKKNLLKQISALIITAMLFSARANAQIVYTDVNPDTTVTCSTPPCSNSYNLDLNNDGTNDFVITHSYNFVGCASGRAYQNNIWVTPLSTNQVVGYSGFSATKMTPNAIINATVLTWNDSVNQSMASILRGPILCTGQAGQWISAADGYLGLKLIAGSNTYYGWARISTIFASSFTIKDYAYNSIPNQPIRAGETSCSIPTVNLTQSGPLSFCAGDSVTITANGTGYQYQWKKNNVNIAGATSQTYVAKTAGTYKCKVTNSCGSKTSGTRTVTIVCLKTDASNLSMSSNASEHLSVYPNPATNAVTIKFPSDAVGTIQIVNHFGQTVYSAKVNAAQTQIDVSRFAAGMYVIRWSSGEKIETKTFSVTK